MKIRSFILLFGLMTAPLVAQEPEGSAAVSSEASAAVSPAPTVVPSVAASQSSFSTPSTQNDGLRKEWLAEAASAGNAEAVEVGETVQDRNLVGKTLVLKGVANGLISVVNGTVYVVGTANRDVTVVNGDLVILGVVKGSAYVSNGNLRVAGSVENASVIGGKIIRAPGAFVRSATELGNSGVKTSGTSGQFNVSITGEEILEILRKMGLSEDDSKPLSAISHLLQSSAYVLFSLFSLLLWIALAVLAEFFFPEVVAKGAASLVNNGTQSFLVGTLFWIVFWSVALVSVVLCLVLIGIPLVAGLAFAFLAVKAFGLAMVYQLVGLKVAQRFEWTRVNAIQAVLIGGVTLGALELIPFAGFWIGTAVGIFGAGVVTLLVAQHLSRTSQVATAPVVPPSVPPV